jgi:hypothetical protein
MTLAWTTVLVVALPRRRTVAWGAAAGLAIGVADLAVADRRFPAIAALPRLPQLADHLTFGALVGLACARQADARRGVPSGVIWARTISMSRRCAPRSGWPAASTRAAPAERLVREPPTGRR